MDVDNTVFRNLLMEKLLEVRTSQYRDAEDERQDLFENETEANDDFPIWAEIEVFASDMLGYASQIASKGYVSSPQETIERLRKFSLFNKPNFRSWYLSDENPYPKLKTLARTLDYIRLLVIEHINMDQADEINTRS